MFYEFNPMKIEDRKSLLDQIMSVGNINRKNKSIKEFEIYKNKIEKYVKENLTKHNSKNYAESVVLIESVEITKKVVNNQGSLYREAPIRVFSHKKKTQKEIDDLYKKMKINRVNKTQNRNFVLQGQSLSYIVPNSSKQLVKKILKLHEFDVIENANDPSDPFGYVISNYNQPKDKSKQRFVLWTKDYNFTMDGNGNILEKTELELKNPISPKLPFSEISQDKDGSYFVEDECTSVDFNVKMAQALSEMYHIMRMQGFGQAVLKGSEDAIPKQEYLDIGPNKILTLILGEDEDCDFSFVNANPDLNGIINVISTLLSAFLTTKNVDPKKINFNGETAKSFSSGFERFLSLLDEFKATADDMELMQDVEVNDFEIIKAYQNAYKSTSYISDDYKVKSSLEGLSVSVEYKEPEIVETKSEREERARNRYENGEISLLEKIKIIHQLKTIEEAKEKYKQILEEEKEVRLIDQEFEIIPEDNEDNEDDNVA